MRRESPSRPKPQSVETISRSGGTYSSALRMRFGHHLRRLDGRRRVAHDADGDLLVGPVLAEEREVAPARRRALEREHVGVGGEEIGERALVRGALPVERLLVRVPPARVEPDLGLDAPDLAVEGVGEELEVGVGRAPVDGGAVVARLLHLDHPAPGGRHLAQLGVEDVGDVEDQLTLRGVVPVHEHLGEDLGADRAELHRPVGEPLGRPPERGVLERAGLDPLAHDGRLVGLHDLVEDVAGPEGPARRPPSGPRGR